MTTIESAKPSRTVLITGGAGFIGSHLVDYLLGRGIRVIAVDDLSTGKIENLEQVLDKPNFQFVRADVRDEIVMDRLASQSEIIIHLAAAVGVMLIVKHPVKTIETNIMGTEAVLKSAFRYGCRVLIASTSEVYGKGNGVPFAEEDDVRLGPTSKSRWSYAASKMVDEFLGLAYHNEKGLEVINFRLFNVVGPRQTGRYGMVVPRFIQQALREEPITVFGDGSQSRCFCGVQDVVQAIWELALHNDTPGKSYNIGSTEEVTILSLARKIKSKTKSKSEISFVPYSEVYFPGFEDMQRRVPDVSRIMDQVGWRQQNSLDQVLNSVIGYEKSHLD